MPNNADDALNDRLYALLPAVYRSRDLQQGEPLRALLSIISEQVDLVEDNIAQLYDNWFIETCEDWVVPYLAELIGYHPVKEAGEPGEVNSAQGRARNKILVSRREVANTVRYRRRKGTLALLELLAADVSGWPVRVVEYYPLLGWTQTVNHPNLQRGRWVDVRNSAQLEHLGTAFDSLAHSVDVRRISSPLRQGRYNLPSIGVFVWRLQAFAVTCTPAACLEQRGASHFTFSILGNDTPLFVKAQPEADPTQIAGELNLPIPMSRRLLERHKAALYGEGKSLCIWRKVRGKLQPVLLEQIQVANLDGWQYQPVGDQVLVDPERGRIAFPASRKAAVHGVWVSYHYGLSDRLGGGEYERAPSEPDGAVVYQVAEHAPFSTLKEALKQWEMDNPIHAVIEIADNRVYTEAIRVDFADSSSDDDGAAGEEAVASAVCPVLNQRLSLQIRAANGSRPILYLADMSPNQSDALVVSGHQRNQLVLDGLLVAGRGIQIEGDLHKFGLRHTTLVPGWGLDSDCNPNESEPSLEIASPRVRVEISHSIVGSIQIAPTMPVCEDDNNVNVGAEQTLARCQGIGVDYRLDPIRVCISDSIVDATAVSAEAIGAPGCQFAHAVLNMQRCTVFGEVHVHAIEEASDSIFMGKIQVARSQLGSMRFSYILPESRTPRRYQCLPDKDKKPAIIPRFISMRYGHPGYAQLTDGGASGIRSGAEDGAEMGVFHDLFQPQREANLRVRLDEYIPAGADVGMIKMN